jgi:hypothetical protein
VFPVLNIMLLPPLVGVSNRVSPFLLQVKLETVLKQQAYMLLYKRRELPPAPAPLTDPITQQQTVAGEVPQPQTVQEQFKEQRSVSYPPLLLRGQTGFGLFRFCRMSAAMPAAGTSNSPVVTSMAEQDTVARGEHREEAGKISSKLKAPKDVESCAVQTPGESNDKVEKAANEKIGAEVARKRVQLMRKDQEGKVLMPQSCR